VAADPRVKLAAAVYEVAVASRERADLLKPLEMEHVEKLVARAKGLRRLAEGAGPAAVVEAIAGLSFAEKCALVDLAVQAAVGGGGAG
jgi:hypothetical protein